MTTSCAFEEVTCDDCDEVLGADYFEIEDERTRMGNIHTVGPNQALIVSGEY